MNEAENPSPFVLTAGV
uniref:Uncharacterized protein n=1 Tax=Arundo donax TaxID=35708 RepID=A0A0A9GWV5_ARUDO